MACDFDSFGKNYYMYHDVQNKLPFRYSNWDDDASFGDTWTGAQQNMTSRLWGTMGNSDDGMDHALMSVPEYRASYLLNLQCLMQNGIFHPDALQARVNKIVQLIRPWALRDDAVWLPRASPKNLTFDQQVQYPLF